jgi:hypothetical protein
MQSVEHLLSELAHHHFYGSVEIKFEAGKVVLLRKTETIKPDEDLRSNRGNSNDQNQPARA